MSRHASYSPRKLIFRAAVPALAVIAASAAVSAPALARVPAERSASSGHSLAASWTGKYQGAFRGTFKLHWQQHGSKLSGTITISQSGGGRSTTIVTGHVDGNSIQFGSVGGQAIHYSGSISGKTMSGTWKIAVAHAGGGSWSASAT